MQRFTGSTQLYLPCPFAIENGDNKLPKTVANVFVQFIEKKKENSKFLWLIEFCKYLNSS